MRLALVALLASAACGGSPPHPDRDVIENHPLPSAPRGTPAPSVAFVDGKFATNMLPAVARGGEVVVVPISGGDAGRGYPNLKLELHDRTDKVVQTIDVMASSEFETMVVDGKPQPALQKRIAAANAELVRQHDVHDLVAMHTLELQKPAEGEPHLAIGDGMDVDWNQTHLHVLHHNTDREVTTYDGTPWLVKDHAPCPKCTPCENPAHLDGVWHAEGVKLLVIQIGYRGTDTCWEPADQMHVVVW